jgi:hypothetical protein
MAVGVPQRSHPNVPTRSRGRDHAVSASFSSHVIVKLCAPGELILDELANCTVIEVLGRRDQSHSVAQEENLELGMIYCVSIQAVEFVDDDSIQVL